MEPKPKASLRRKAADYEARFAQWKRDNEAYILEHGQEAYDQKLEREIAELYPES